ncbi:hypothetical protein [Kocuria varians]|uniref:hypothetical protein n=1 Tax=Kocuria varians TaxID=1272 RepID=UPI000838ED44|nr:hypothetical protein [Kocuria varians]
MRRLIIPLTLAAASLVLTGCGAFTPEAAPTVTVTATPSDSYVHTGETMSASEQDTQGEAAAADATQAAEEPAATQIPAWDPNHRGPSASVDEYLRADLPHLYNPNTPITKIGVEDDDVIVDYKIPMHAHATENYAPATVKEIAAVLRQHTDDPNIAALDLVAVRTSDGATAAMEQVTPHPQCAGCTVPPSTPTP